MTTAATVETPTPPVDKKVIDDLVGKKDAPATPAGLNLDSEVRVDGRVYTVKQLLDDRAKLDGMKGLEEFRDAALSLYKGGEGLSKEQIKQKAETFYRAAGLEGARLKEEVDKLLEEEPAEEKPETKKGKAKETEEKPASKSVADQVGAQMVTRDIRRGAERVVADSKVIKDVLEYRKKAGEDEKVLDQWKKTLLQAANDQIANFVRKKVVDHKEFREQWIDEGIEEANKYIENYARLHYGDVTKLGPAPAVTPGSVLAEQLKNKPKVEFPKINDEKATPVQMRRQTKDAIKDAVLRQIAKETTNASV